MEKSNLKYVPTSEFAESFGVKATTVHRNLCVNGHYMGIRPIKLPNGRLLWPEESVQLVIESVSR